MQHSYAIGRHTSAATTTSSGLVTKVCETRSGLPRRRARRDARHVARAIRGPRPFPRGSSRPPSAWSSSGRARQRLCANPRTGPALAARRFSTGFSTLREGHGADRRPARVVCPVVPQFPDALPSGASARLATCRSTSRNRDMSREAPNGAVSAPGRAGRGQTPTRTPRCFFNVTNPPPRRPTPYPSPGWSEPIGCCRSA